MPGKNWYGHPLCLWLKMSTPKSFTARLNMSFNPVSENDVEKNNDYVAFVLMGIINASVVWVTGLWEPDTRKIWGTTIPAKTGSQKDVLGTELGIFDMLNEHEWMLNFSLFPIFLVGSTLLIEISCQRGQIPWTCGRNVCWINVRFLIASHHVYPA